MQVNQHNLGELCSVHRPLTFHIWTWSALAFFPLLLFLFGGYLTLDGFNSFFTQGRGKFSETLSNAFACLGCIGLPLAVLVILIVSEFRKWLATRTVRLTIYQKGFTYESGSRTEVCRWDEIERLNFRFVPTYSKAFIGSKVKVIRSVVRKDGTVISLAETLNLIKITELIKAQKGAGFA